MADEEAKTDANWRAIEEAKDTITSKYPMVWHIEAIFSSSVVFYYSDDEISENEKTGISQKIAGDYYSILKKYDELNYFTPENLIIKFDSREAYSTTHSQCNNLDSLGFTPFTLPNWGGVNACYRAWGVFLSTSTVVFSMEWTIVLNLRR